LPKLRYEKTVRADRRRIFEIATDYESFPKSMPQYFPSVRIRSSRDNVTVVEEHVRLSSRNLAMMTKHVIERPTSHEVFVIGGDLKGSRIAETYREIPEGTHMTVDADIRLRGAMRLAGLFGRTTIADDLVAITDELAKSAEG